MTAKSTTTSRFLLAALTPLLSATLSAPPVGAREADPIIIRVSVKRITSSTGDLPSGRWGSAVEITRTISRANDALARSGAENWRIGLVEIVDTGPAVAEYYEMPADDIASLERDAIERPTAFSWRSDAVNIYVADRLTDAGGVCSFPTLGSHHEAIVINSRGILGGSEGWLHELGHYFNLIHTHEGDGVVDTIQDSVIPSPFDCALHDQNFLASPAAQSASSEDVFNLVHNVMSYHCDPRVLTPLQLVRMRRAMLDYRQHVIDEPAVEGPPSAVLEIAGEATGGPLDLSRGPAKVVLDSSASAAGDGADRLMRSWALESGDPDGVQLDSPLASWSRGCSGIGYGDHDDVTELDMRSRYITVYLNRSFEVKDPSALGTLALDVTYDDGFAAYLNGVEVARRNLDPDPGPYTVASSTIENTRELIDLTSFMHLLRAGANRLSIEVHNAAAGSSDLSMHPVLRATRDSGGEELLIRSRDLWFYLPGVSPDAPEDWNEADFDPSASHLTVTFLTPGTYRFSVTVWDIRDTEAVDVDTVEMVVTGKGAVPSFVRGDCNRDLEVDVSDAVAGLLVLFGGLAPAPCADACDTNDDESHDVSDAIALLQYLFGTGVRPPPPFPEEGIDPEGEALGCAGE